MDFVSHGLWGGITFGRKNKRSFWSAFFIGMAPDILAFGPFFLFGLLGFSARPAFGGGGAHASLIPSYVYALYSITHSLVVFAFIFLALWAWKRKPYWELSAWGLHVLFDIPLHAKTFFPTPFLWPLSSFTINGISWGSPLIFFPNLLVLVVLYAARFFIKRRRATKTSN